MRQITYILLIGLILSACVSLTSWPQPIFLGGFPEKNYEFMESLEHNSTNNYYETIKHLKWAGTRWGQDLENKMFMWLRNPDNLTIAFNTFEFVGLEKFINVEQYCQKIFDDDYWEFDWNGKSLHDICNILIDCYSDSTGIEGDFQNFWERRRLEKNDSATYEILKRIDRFYVSKTMEILKPSREYDSVMYQLLNYDIKMQKSDSLTRTKIIVDYFDYLKQVGLEHSAFNLIYEIEEFHYLRINRDSLVLTLNYDTIPQEKYWKVRNNAIWVKSREDNGP